jgi:hypothetical protein
MKSLTATHRYPSSLISNIHFSPVGKLLDEGAIHLEMDMIMLDRFRLIPSAHLRQHLLLNRAAGD